MVTKSAGQGDVRTGSLWQAALTVLSKRSGLVICLLVAWFWVPTGTAEHLMVSCVATLARALNISATHVGASIAEVGTRSFFYNHDCLYGDLMIVAGVLAWRRRTGAMGNVLRVVLVVVFVAGTNILRAVLSVVLQLEGWSRVWAHDVPDLLLWYGIMLALLGLAARAETSTQGQVWMKASE